MRISMLVILVLITSCKRHEPRKEVRQLRYANTIDTIYKGGSKEVKEVVRTFYRYVNYENNKDVIKLSRGINDTSFLITMVNMEQDKIKSQGTIRMRTSNDLNSFFTLIDSIFKSERKDLKFPINSNPDEMISNSYSNDVMIFKSLGPLESVSFFITKPELDSMKNCFDRFVSE